jgi:hypothetical protein
VKHGLWIVAGVLLLIVGVALAQDTGGEPIAPGGGPLPTATLIPTLVPTFPPTQTVLPPTMNAPSTVVATATTGLGVPVVTATALPVTVAPVLGATAIPTPVVPRVTVIVGSAFVREAPAFDANPIASVFRDDGLEVIGRNADGTFYQVRRPRRTEALGWISIEVIETPDGFAPEFLPLTDTVTGLTGDIPLPDTDLAVFINEGVALRTLPDRQRGQLILNIPPSVIVPVIAGYRDNEWLRVNYLGNEGWIIGFTIRERDGLDVLPQITGIFPGDNVTLSALVVPPEIQREQLERVREYATARLVVATDLANFWFLVQQGEVLPCNPPASVVAYQYGGQDVRQLPELDRYVPRMNEGIGYLNESIAVLAQCGVIDPFTVNEARNDAINSRIILENTLVQLDNIEELIR